MKVDCERGSIRTLTNWVSAVDPDRVLVVRGTSSFEASGAAPAIAEALSGAAVDYTVARPNPDSADVAAWSKSFRASRPDAIVAIGGGSVLDTAKLIRHFGSLKDAEPKDVVPLVAIPTTAGSGAEATHFAVMYDNGVKQSIAHQTMRPNATILDPALTDGVPPEITASTGFDALSQAVESAWSVNSTAATRSISFEAIALAADNLVGSVVDPSHAHRDAMMKAAHLAGIAIDTTFTTAPHALSYKLTSSYGVPHGHAVALTLGQVLEYNDGTTDSDCVDPRGPDHVRSVIDHICQLLDADSAADAALRIRTMLKKTGLADSLAAVGASTEESLLSIADSVNIERLANNPRALDRAGIMGILRAIS